MKAPYEFIVQTHVDAYLGRTTYSLIRVGDAPDIAMYHLTLNEARALADELQANGAKITWEEPS